MPDLITEDLVRLDADLGGDKEATIRSLAAVVADAGRSTDVDAIIADALAREATSPTGLPGRIAIPHCRTTGVSEPTLAFARLEPGVDFGAKDGPADLAFLITAPAGGDATHLQLLTKLARALVKPSFTGSLRDAETPAEVVALVNDALGVKAEAPAETKAQVAASTDEAHAPDTGILQEAEAPAGSDAAGAAAGAAGTTGAPSGGGRSLVAVTACPTGIAHTYMAAEALEAAAARAGVTLAVETQGSAGSTPLAPDRSSATPRP